MEIKFIGHSSFLIKTKTIKILTDPFDPQVVGLKFPKVDPDVITISHYHQDHNFVKPFQSASGDKNPLIIDIPGEFEKQGTRIFGFKSYHDKNQGKDRGENIIFKIETKEGNILHCGDLGMTLSDNFIDDIGDIDILIVPIGGFYTIDSDEAFELTKKIEPSIVIPMHYNHPMINQEVFGKLSGVEEFTRKFGIEKPSFLPKLIYKKEEVDQEMKVIVLEIN